MRTALLIRAFAAIFGILYASFVSTMWGLDTGDPRTGIAAMQALNVSVRNVVFTTDFIGTGPALALTAGLA